MKTKLKRRIVLFFIAAAVIAVVSEIIVQMVQSKRPRTGDVMFTMPANGSSGEYYEYAFDRDDILRETDSYIESFFLNFGPGYNDVWEFDIIGEGDLTVSWTSYCGGTDIVREECFTETYRVEDGKCTKISDTCRRY
ncbi:MAG: hypothetical protein K2N38_02545 [Oscillospiraceae bacterium]|nr:hypothetical protein [Oscillospiraceae bacterium]